MGWVGMDSASEQLQILCKVSSRCVKYNKILLKANKTFHDNLIFLFFFHIFHFSGLLLSLMVPGEIGVIVIDTR